MSERFEADAELTASERELGDALASDRPIPSAGFRGALGRHLHSRDPGYGTRPARLRLTVSGLLAAGAILIALGLLQAAGAL
jgi:hypothetical protein